MLCFFELRVHLGLHIGNTDFILRKSERENEEKWKNAKRNKGQIKVERVK
jgi:hypothetical protein